jgi:hypothetical protein
MATKLNIFNGKKYIFLRSKSIKQNEEELNILKKLWFLNSTITVRGMAPDY